jgi:pyruvate dehydrogenase E1 component beta subunit
MVGIMKFKEIIKLKCEEYAKNPLARFIGYNTVYGSRMYGTLSDINPNQCIESPVAENLMAGLAMGMSLEGYRPVLCFERHDFILLALDALVNQMDKMPWMSGDKFKYPILLRAIVGGKKPIDPGPMHSQNYSKALSTMLKNTPVFEPMTVDAFDNAWAEVGRSNSGAVIIVEHKDLYETELL